MAGSVNKVILIGNVGRDPEMRTGQSGKKIANLSLATSESWNDKHTGERREKTEWHRVVVFNERLADIVERFVKKGSKIYVEGELQTRKWTDQGGQERFSTEVVLSDFRGSVTLLSSRDDGEQDARPASRTGASGATRAGGRPGSMSDGYAPPAGADDDEIPF